MQYINQRNIKIIDELINFCYSQDSNHVSIDIKTEDRKTTFTIKTTIPNLSKAVLDDLERLLNCPRCHEMEECYWELGGNDDMDCKLSLIGMMIDSAIICYDNPYLTITLTRTI